MPKVSIITPLFNGEKHIASTIRSVMDQTFADYEHLIIDNNSTDGGTSIVRDFAARDPRIKLLSNPQHPGAGPTRNMGINVAQGDIIAFLDADDSWLPTKLERQVAFMEEKNLAFSWTGYMAHDEAGLDLREVRAARYVTYEDLLYKRIVIGCLTAAYDTRVLGKRFMNDLPMRQDFCLWLDLMKAADEAGLAYGGLDECLARYRVHAGGMTSNKMKAAKMQWRAYREHVGLGRLKTAWVFSSYALHAVAARLKAKLRSKTGAPCEPADRATSS